MTKKRYNKLMQAHLSEIMADHYGAGRVLKALKAASPIKFHRGKDSELARIVGYDSYKEAWEAIVKSTKLNGSADMYPVISAYIAKHKI